MSNRLDEIQERFDADLARIPQGQDITQELGDIRYLLNRVREFEKAVSDYVSQEGARRACGESFFSECYQEHAEYVEESWDALVKVTRGLLKGAEQ